jgi:mono/diheme cytochrome c family protein
MKAGDRRRFDPQPQGQMRVSLKLFAVAAIAAAAWIGSGATAAAEPRGPVQAPDGKSVYLDHCKTCHGVIGVPTKSAVSKYDSIPNFKTPGFFDARSQDSIVTILKKGKGKDMKSWSEKLTEPEMQAVAAYIRTFAVAK